MQLQPQIAQVAEQLAAAAALGDDRTREVAAALTTAAGPAVRLALMSALTAAADEITAALLDFPGAPAVTVRLDGDEVSVDVHATAVEADGDDRRDDGDANARISLRLSESLKADIDAAADQDGVSVNTWLVRVASAALRNPFAAGFGGFAPGPGRGRGDARKRVSGWVNG
jgi:hypothetical protein